MLKELSPNKSLNQLFNTNLLKERFLNPSLKKKYILTTKLLNTKKNMFLELSMIPSPNKSPLKESNTSQSKELNTLPKKKPNMLLNLDKLKELNMMKLNIKFKDLKFNKLFNNQLSKLLDNL